MKSSWKVSDTLYQLFLSVLAVCCILCLLNQCSFHSVQDSEVKLLGQAKRSHAELVRLQEDLEREEEQSNSEEPESEVTKLRQQILHAYNDLKAAEDRDHQTQYELEW